MFQFTNIINYIVLVVMVIKVDKFIM